ncbi:MAG: hypothetical protein ABIC68_05990 [Candidatus Omnitrophota bacterium]
MQRRDGHYNMTEWRNKLWENDSKVRKMGCFFIGIAIFLGFMSIYLPRIQALKGENKIFLFDMAPMAMVTSFIFGSLMFVMGKRAERLLRADEISQITLSKILTYVICVGLGVFIGIYLRNWIMNVGYMPDSSF